MAQQFFSRRNINFLLNEVYKVDELTHFDLFKDHSQETFDLIIDTISKMAAEVMYPIFQEMDSNPPWFEDGVAHVHPQVRPFMREYGAGGWINSTMAYELGGQQVPNTINFVSQFIIAAANYSLSAYVLLTAGAANLLTAFGSPQLKDIYLPDMLAGAWQGTMALTEPNAGSSLADIRTQAEDSGLGYYRIKGQKIFITGGSTDATDNTVHMMLARIKGAPAGVKGISLFLVPKYRVEADGTLAPNDIVCTGIEHKLGYKGCPACQLAMGDQDDCHGFLVGEANRGLGYMFQMMNEERINVGMGAVAKATAAYYASLEYSRERRQNRKLTDKNPESPQIPIIEHADIKRLLLFQRAVAEGALALALQVSKYIDLARVNVEQEKNELLVDFLVPIVKTYPSEMGILSTSAAIQCLGGYGYCKDFPVEQYFRDVRIDPIHEGTTGIQGQDILGRKATMQQGKAYNLFLEEVEKTISSARKISSLQPYTEILAHTVVTLNQVTRHLLNYAAQGQTERFLADATLYLELAGIVAIGWQWLKQGEVAAQALAADPNGIDRWFYQGKLTTLGYFFDYEMPKVENLQRTITRSERFMSEVPLEIFEA
ncbi:MAG: acyl-CoA dehydrogenase [Methylocystaceae bacterium]